MAQTSTVLPENTYFLRDPRPAGIIQGKPFGLKRGDFISPFLTLGLLGLGILLVTGWFLASLALGSLLFAFTALFILGILIFMGFGSSRQLPRYFRSLQQGQVLQGEIIKSTLDPANRGGSRKLNLSYQFFSPSGNILRGEETQRLRYYRDSQNLPQIATPVAVVFLNEDYYYLI